MYDPKKWFSGREVDKCRDRLIRYCVGVGLDVGCGGRNSDLSVQENKIHPLAIGCDLGLTNLTGPADDLRWIQDETMDYLFSSHLLEHMHDLAAVLREWWRVLRPGGYLVLYLPLKGAYPSVGQRGANKDHKHNLDPMVMLKLCDSYLQTGFEVVRIEERVEGEEYSFDFVVRKKDE